MEEQWLHCLEDLIFSKNYEVATASYESITTVNIEKASRVYVYAVRPSNNVGT